jgi:SRSO17 transposase
MRKGALAILGLVMLAGCSAKVLLQNSDVHLQPTETIDHVMVLVTTYPTWPEQSREHFAKKMVEALVAHGVVADQYVYSETALNEDVVVKEKLESFGTRYVLRANQTDESWENSIIPTVVFLFKLTERESETLLWSGEVSLEASRRRGIWAGGGVGKEAGLYQVGEFLPAKLMAELKSKGFLD